MDLKNYELVIDSQDVGDVLNHLDRSPYIALDLETTGLDPITDLIHGIALATEDREWYVCRGAGKAILPGLAEMLEEKETVMHNAAFDLHFLQRYGIDVTNLVDTMIAEHLINEEEAKGLKDLARTRLGFRGQLPEFKDMLRDARKMLGRRKIADTTIYDIPLHKIGKYAGLDARMTYDLKPKTLAALKEEGMDELFWNVEMPYVRVIIEMEGAGFRIDQRELLKFEEELRGRLTELQQQWEETAGDVNPNSNDQLARHFYEDLGLKVTETTPGGRPSTNKLALQRIASKDKQGRTGAAVVLEMREVEKLISTYIINIRDNLVQGRLHANFNQTGTVTWRLSSSGNINLQNIPQRTELGKRIRSLFVVEPGNKFVSADYSQLELRLIAHYSKDENMLRIFRENLDPHQHTADRAQAQGYNLERGPAKSVNYGWIYGIGPRGLQNWIEQAGGEKPTLEEARSFLEGFDAAYPGAREWKLRVLQHARRLGYVKTIWGHKRRLPDLNSPDMGLRSYAERQAPNAIIQGTAGDCIKYAQLQILPHLSDYDARMLSQVHDELNFEVPANAAPEFAKFAQQKMEEAQEYFGIRVKLIAEPAIADNWADAH